jgi:hypothetical protein
LVTPANLRLAEIRAGREARSNIVNPLPFDALVESLRPAGNGPGRQIEWRVHNQASSGNHDVSRIAGQDIRRRQILSYAGLLIDILSRLQYVLM